MSIRGEVPEGYFKQITLTLNPWSANSWIKARFFDNPNNLTFIKTTTYKCNEWLDASDLELFEDMRLNNPRRYQIEGLGEWGIAEGLIYENVEYEAFNIEAVRAKEGVKACFGLDFGYTDPTAFVAMLVDEKEKTIYVFDEWYARKSTNDKTAEQLIKMGYGGQRIICDSAEPKSIQELINHGIRNAEASRKGGDSVLHGIQLIQNYKIVVHPNCPEFFREVSNYCWEKDKFDKPTDKPDHEWSHCMDAMRYGVSKLLVGSRFSWD